MIIVKSTIFLIAIAAIVYVKISVDIYMVVGVTVMVQLLTMPMLVHIYPTVLNYIRVYVAVPNFAEFILMDSIIEFVPDARHIQAQLHVSGLFCKHLTIFACACMIKIFVYWNEITIFLICQLYFIIRLIPNQKCIHAVPISFHLVLGTHQYLFIYMPITIADCALELVLTIQLCIPMSWLMFLRYFYMSVAMIGLELVIY